MDDLSVLQDILKNEVAAVTLIVLSKPHKSCAYKKIRICPAATVTAGVNDSPLFRVESFTQTQSFTESVTGSLLFSFIVDRFPGRFRTVVLEMIDATYTFLANKKGRVTVLKKQKPVSGVITQGDDNIEDNSHIPTVRPLNGCAKGAMSTDSLKASTGAVSGTARAHNRTKNYIIKEGVPVPFLVRLGVMTQSGKIVAQKYDKFRQINRFLEYIDDILPSILAAKETDNNEASCNGDASYRAEASQNDNASSAATMVAKVDASTGAVDSCVLNDASYNGDASSAATMVAKVDASSAAVDSCALDDASCNGDASYNDNASYRAEASYNDNASRGATMAAKVDASNGATDSCALNDASYNGDASNGATDSSTSPEASAFSDKTRAQTSISVIDFGCGKSYLTFAVYHYLTAIKGLDAHIIGLDLKADVIAHCSALAAECGYKNLSFKTGDIAQYRERDAFDLVITLHACDTATDFALAKAVGWNARAILSVPCCQHELNAQLNRAAAAPEFSLLLKYGIIKERFASLVTDVMRAELLRAHGYNVQLLEFIDMTHTPKNVLIRAVRQTKPDSHNAEPSAQYRALKNALGIHLTPETLLMNNTPHSAPKTKATAQGGAEHDASATQKPSGFDVAPVAQNAAILQNDASCAHDASKDETCIPCAAKDASKDETCIPCAAKDASPVAHGVKIIALDLDDTLLRDDLTISDYTVSVLRRVVQNGIYVVLCSGRTENAILPYVRQLQIAGNEYGRYMISQNGSTIYDMHTRKAIYSRTVPSAILIDAYRRAIKHGLSCEVYDSSTIYSPVLTKWVERDKNLSGLKLKIVEDYARFLEQGFPKMVISGESETIVKLQDECKAVFENKAVVFTSKPYFLEILPFDTGKGEALQYLAETVLGLSRNQTMGFGDSMNDESMIRYAAHSTAMINGLDAIKNQAAHVTDFSNNQDGVARFIDKNCL